MSLSCCGRPSLPTASPDPPHDSASGPAPSSAHHTPLQSACATFSTCPHPTTNPTNEGGRCVQLLGYSPSRVVWFPRSARCRSSRQGRCRRQTSAAPHIVYVQGTPRQGLLTTFNLESSHDAKLAILGENPLPRLIDASCPDARLPKLLGCLPQGRLSLTSVPSPGERSH